jgi:hypothetical protein
MILRQGRACGVSSGIVPKEPMRRVNLDPNADYVGNRPPKPVDAQAIRKFSQRRPMIDIEDGSTRAGLKRQRRRAGARRS